MNAQLLHAASDLAIDGVPSYDAVFREFVEAEHSEGWLVRCADQGRFLAMNAALVIALHEVLTSIGAGVAVEVCAGRGELAAALRRAGSVVVATDACPPRGCEQTVQALTAAEALHRLRPAVVIGSFVPVDARVHDQVLGDPAVRHYLVLAATLPGGDGGLPRQLTGWHAESLPAVTRWMISRHDVFVGDARPIVTHGEAMLYARQSNSHP